MQCNMINSSDDINVTAVTCPERFNTENANIAKASDTVFSCGMGKDNTEVPLTALWPSICRH